MARGGRRPGAGQPAHDPPLHDCKVLLTEEQIKLLRKWGRGNVSAGLRWLIDRAKLVVRRDDDEETPAG